jgi:hypothetical protein
MRRLLIVAAFSICFTGAATPQGTQSGDCAGCLGREASRSPEGSPWQLHSVI